MNKRVSMVLVIALAAAGTIFASGTGERPSNVEAGRRLTTDTTEVTITGTIAYRDDVPVLITDDGVFSLSTRRGGIYSSDLEDGMELTVTGEQIAALEDNPHDADYHIFLDSAVVDGETYTFDEAGGRVATTTREPARRSNGSRTAARDGSGGGQGASSPGRNDGGRGSNNGRSNDSSRGNGPGGRR